MRTYDPSIVVCHDADEVADYASQQFFSLISENAESVLGLATGGTPVRTYQRLISCFQNGSLSFSQATSFNLDEYIGLSAEHSESFRFFMQQHLFDHVDFAEHSTFVPDGMAADPEKYAQEYESKIRSSGGIDLQLLGIGHNGHIAFNEPGSTPDSRTRVVDLTDSTIEKNSRFFDSIDDVPHKAITMGIGTIIEAKRIMLLATGKGKADAVCRAIHSPPSKDVPASWLQTHRDVVFVLDRDAASEIS